VSGAGVESVAGAESRADGGVGVEQEQEQWNSDRCRNRSRNRAFAGSELKSENNFLFYFL
jgi:hypothetical protein